MTALIFGAGGQDGFYLNRLCVEKGYRPVGISRSGDWLKGDVSNYSQVKDLIKSFRPKYIFHLAACSSTKHDALFDNHAAISTGTINILEAVYRHSRQTRVFITGSGLQFENTDKPISERNEFDPNSPYSVSRINSAYTARYFRSLGIQTYIGYLFHHESPLRKIQFVSQKIVSAAKRIAQGSSDKLQIRSISVEKEWTFSGDVVRGMLTLMEQDQVYEAVIGSGKAYSIEKWLELCFGLIGRHWQDHVCIDEDYKPEYTRLVSDPSTMFSLGWSPKVGMEELARMMMTTT
ncbi:GDP-mannose 4,6-dehydratase [Phosphitispora fastidiosa]|uniref:GDP-mannose 4,6-dehydratase n=1 Tax=Phosphitispora fastidiosa TaxID=2837202 RepID=UPI001E35A273|nr:GDP-mannose 4,6-dehydratase [Phosphitispora fastidiosa]MBU7008558.1 GDPmannose 4 [Phosphitispora fastidiosa]